MPKHQKESSTPSRRQFLQLGGAAALACAASSATAQSPAAKADSTKGKSLNLSIASYTFRAFNLDKTIEMTKRAGIKNICLKSMHMPLDAKPDVLAATAAKIAAAGLTLYGAGVIDMVKETQIKQAFEYGKAAGLRLLVVSPAPEVLPLVEEQVKKYDISVAIHNHGPDDRRFPTPKSAYDAVASLDPRIGLCIDIGHTVRAGADLVDSINRYHDRLFEMHIKDVTEAAKKGRCIQLGRGVIDIVAMIQALLKVGYKGTFSYEWEAEEKDPMPGLCECIGYTKGVLATLEEGKQNG
jgi:sugar phosphate isomerase/epimerase